MKNIIHQTAIDLASIFFMLTIIIIGTVVLGAEEERFRDFEISLAKGQYEIELGNYAAAAVHLEQALRLMPENQEARVSLGIAYSRSGDLKKARVVLEQAVAADSSDARAKYELALVLAEMGEQSEAERMMKTVSETSRDESLSAAALGFLTRQKSEAQPSLKITAGFQYDSNVILEQDNPVSPTGEKKADTREVIVLDGSVPFTAGRFGAEAGYRFYQSLHNSLEDFNVQQHQGRLTGTYADFRSTRIDIGYKFRYSLLGGEHYSTSHEFAPRILFNQANQSLAELHGVYETKRFFNTPDYPALSEKNGTHAAAGLAYTFLLGEKTGISMDYTYDQDDAEKNYWDYTGHRGAVSILGRFEAYRLFATLSYHDKKYKAPPPGASEKRHDGVQEISAGISRKTGKNITVTLSSQYMFNDSNIALYEYRRNIIGLFAEIAL